MVTGSAFPLRTLASDKIQSSRFAAAAETRTAAGIYRQMAVFFAH